MLVQTLVHHQKMLCLRRLVKNMTRQRNFARVFMMYGSIFIIIQCIRHHAFFISLLLTSSMRRLLPLWLSVLASCNDCSFKVLERFSLDFDLWSSSGFLDPCMLFCCNHIKRFCRDNLYNALDIIVISSLYKFLLHVIWI